MKRPNVALACFLTFLALALIYGPMLAHRHPVTCDTDTDCNEKNPGTNGDPR